MLFLFGIRNSTLKNRYLLQDCKCPNCDEINTLVSGTTAGYFHLFFIPIFPTSKSDIAICNHCNAKFPYSQFTEEMKQDFDKQKATNPNSTPVWHGCGCLLVVFFFFIMVVLSVVSWFKSKSEPEKPEDQRELLLVKDLAKATKTPKEEADSTSFYIKDYIDYAIQNELDKKNIKYFSKVNGNKILILLDIDDIKKIKISDRYMILTFVNSALDEHEGYENKKIYMGVQGRWNMVLVSAPNYADVEGSFADEKYLYPFYDKASSDTKVDKKSRTSKNEDE